MKKQVWRLEGPVGMRKIIAWAFLHTALYLTLIGLFHF